MYSPDKSRLYGSGCSSGGHVTKHLVLLYLFSFTCSVFLTYAIWCLFQIEIRLVETGSEVDRIRVQLAFSNAQISDQAGRYLKLHDFTRGLEARLELLSEEEGKVFLTRPCFFKKCSCLIFHAPAEPGLGTMPLSSTLFHSHIFYVAPLLPIPWLIHLRCTR